MKAYHPEAFVVSWALRFAASQKTMAVRRRLRFLSILHCTTVSCGQPGAFPVKRGKCEQACPQHLPIREYLDKVKEKFEGESIIPVRK